MNSADSRGRNEKYAFAVLACLLFLAGAGLRVYRLGNAALWGDEVRFLETCHPERPAAEVISYHISNYRDAGHLPFAALISNLTYKLMGISAKAGLTPAISRLPSALAGILTLPLVAIWVYLLTRKTSTSILALGLASLSFIHIWYSREAYYYSYQLLFAFLYLACLSWTLSENSRCHIFTRAACLLVSSLMLLCSHPASVALNIAGALYLLAASRPTTRARLHSLYAALPVLLTSGLLLFFSRSYQEPLPETPYLRFSPFITIVDLVDKLAFGPRAGVALSVPLIVIGIVALAASRIRAQASLMVIGAILFTMLYVGGRHFRHFARYYLLLWPFVICVMAVALDRCCAFFKRHYSTSACACLLIAAFHYIPGYSGMFSIRTKLDDPVGIGTALDEHLDPGTVCYWQAKHLLAYSPNFYKPSQSILIGAYTGVGAEDYVNGSLTHSLRKLTGQFPACAYIEWTGMRPYPARFAGQQQKTRLWEEELALLFARIHVVGDEELESFMRSGWHPCTPPLFADDYDARLEGEIASCATVIYYNTFADSGGAASVQPTPNTWVPVINQHGTPVLLGTPESTFVIAPRAGQADSAKVHLSFITYRPGTLTFHNEDGTVVSQLAHRPEMPQAVILQAASAGGHVFRAGFHAEGTADEWPYFAMIGYESSSEAE